ncbi:uncharacterized protein LOC114877634 isoform X1 [Osmia bicornis bicornis]|uniref:uncharacterized protein LOC114877634 isoform X1 n=2 Tax=Osmia bicornis bicornis TaxID=1437191 RepID=UPI0010FA2C09|nr:uncharacterized protein LOC114877634 isoform X1 [Osmia bicornis bicornis]
MNINNINNEDEDVIIQGTAIYEHLYNLGYMDFESVLIPKSIIKTEEKESKLAGLLYSVKDCLRKCFVKCLKIIQDDDLSNKQINTILNAKVLLSDHAIAIHNFLDKYHLRSWRTTVLQFVSLGVLSSPAMYIAYKTQYKSFTYFFISVVLCYISYIKCLRIQSYVDLRSFVILQNDLFSLCKKGLKILKYGYKIKLNKGKNSQQFYNLTADRLKYLQPMVENLVNCLENASHIHYCTSLILIKLLPANVIHEHLLTKFESTSFAIKGEIHYQKLKTLYHTYILTQSEMLHLMAIAYDNYTWQQSYSKIPELKLIYIIRFLIKRLTVYKNKLSEIVNAYYSFKVEPMVYKYKGPLSTQWQDLYMHVYLASNKLQLAYSHILSILQDIDNVSETMICEDMVENIEQKLNAAQKDIENAKDFVEFSNLFLVKTKINNFTNNPIETNISASVPDSDIPIVYNLEPQILDEVFEEYIKEEYLKPLIDESNEISLYNYKRDKSLIKSFMSELKDVLVDKQKLMSERESKALERMYKNVMKKTTADSQHYQIPIPPPMPSFNAPVVAQNHTETKQTCNSPVDKLQLNQVSEKLDNIKLLSKSQTNLKEKDSNEVSSEETLSIPIITLPKNKEFSSFLPPPFLKADEETFIGSGENSEDEESITDTNDQ